MVCVLEARRGSVPETIALADFMQRCEAYFGPKGASSINRSRRGAGTG
jgi:hypothetical protein